MVSPVTGKGFDFSGTVVEGAGGVDSCSTGGNIGALTTSVVGVEGVVSS